MNETILKVLLSTYSVCLPLLLGYVIKTLTRLHNEKKEGHDRLAEISENFVEEIKELNARMVSLNCKIDYNDAMTSRYRLIRAADEIRNGDSLGMDHLEQLGEDIEIYKDYCKNNPNYKNHKGQSSVRLITEYEEKMLANKLNDSEN